MDDYRELVARAQDLEQDLVKAGLLKTYRVMNSVVQSIGWEVAEKLDSTTRGED